MNLGFSELMIILVIALLLFGVGRISKIGGEMGRGIAAFRDGLKSGQTENDSPESDPHPTDKAE